MTKKYFVYCIVKNPKNHIGQKIKRVRSYRGIRQEDLAKSIGKTRSLISYIERTGIINKETLKEITLVLQTNPEEFELTESDVITSLDEIKDSSIKAKEHAYENLINQLQTDINFLKDIIKHQWELLKENEKNKQ